MALQIPTTKEVAEQIIYDIESKLGQVVPLTPKSVFRVLSYAIAGVFTTLYKFGGWQYLQIFPTTADDEALERWGAIVNVDRTVAQSAVLEIRITGTVGANVPAGTQYIYNTTQELYFLNNSVTILSSGDAIGTITAANAGVAGNIVDGATVSITTPITDIDSDAIVEDTVLFGTDIEDIEQYRNRVVNRMRAVPQGGAYADYQLWSTEVATIVNAYPYSGDLEGTVEVYCESNATASRIPTLTELEQVSDSINLVTRRPVTALVYVYPILITSFDVGVYGLNTTDALIKDRIEEALIAFFLERSPFIDGLSIVNNSIISQTEVISIVNSITSVNNVVFNDATFMFTGTLDSIVLYSLGKGEKSALVEVKYL